MKTKGFFQHLWEYKALYPALTFIGFFVLIPTIYALFVSFREYSYGVAMPGLTLSNYIEIFTSPMVAPRFLNSLLVTLRLWAIAAPPVVLLSLGIALVLNKDFYGNNIIQVSLLFPYAIPSSVNAAMWSWLYDGDFGFVNYILKTVGITDKYITIVGDANLAMYAIVFAYVWKFVPYTTFMILAGLKQIPKEVYDASCLECGRLRSLWHITLPLLKPILLVVLALQTVFVMTHHFSLVFVLTAGGPAGTTRTLVWDIYQSSFEGLRFGRGSALAIILSLVMLLLIYLYLKALGKQGMKGGN